MNTKPDEEKEEAEKPPLPEEREDLLALVREVRGTIAATVLEIGDDEQVLNFVESLQRSNLLPEPPPDEDEDGEKGEADAAVSEASETPEKQQPAKTDGASEAKPATEKKPGPDANPGEKKDGGGKASAATKPKDDAGSDEEEGEDGARRSQVLSYVAKSLQEAAKLLRDAPQDQVELFAKRLRMIVNDLKANLDKPD